MKSRTALFILLLLAIAPAAFSQPICGFDKLHEQRMKSDPVYRETILKQEEQLRQYISKNKINPTARLNSPLAPLYTIPVVVHIMHTGGAVGSIYNPTDAQIQSTITYLNQVYDGTYPGLEGVGDLQIQFVLAQRDPNCNPTNGINRIDASGVAGYVAGGVNVSTTSGTDEINIKNLSRWSNTSYYNIWVVNKIDANDGTSGSFVAGYAYFPGAPATIDGTVMLATQMAPGAKTLPHEVGHAFNLYHPFQVSAGNSGGPGLCPSNINCTTTGDQICDIDPVDQPVGFVCRSGNNTCTSTPYTINSEHNIMNYTNCATLFTADQKTRMLASAGSAPRLSLSTSLGGTPTNVGGSQCAPKINFEFTSDQKSEVTTATTGCRSYTDYTYNMVIGNSPTATATATLNVSGGTATEGVDFDITTNGSFAAPSKLLTFPNGSNASEQFTVRVYDDASVESAESFTLAFTVNSGGGNAVAGDGRPNFTLSINDNDVAPTNGTANGTVTIGTATVTTTAVFDATQQSKRAQFLFKASELTGAGVPAGSITGISLNLQKFSTRAYTNLSIKMGMSAVTYLVNGSVTQVSPITTVKTIASYNTVNGWNDFVFDVPFTWDGVNSLGVEVCYDNGTTAPGDVADRILLFSDGGTAAQGNLFFQTGINCSQSFTSVSFFGSGNKPIIKLNYGIPETPVQTVLNSSRQEYLGPNADVYFYDQTQSKLLARIKNNTNHDYGCTQVIIDRAGTGSTAFWNNNTGNYLMNKTFRVIPTANNPAGNYDISFYFNQAEVNGWQTATGQTFNNIQMIKVPTQISNVTPGNPGGAGTVQIVTPGRGSLGTNYFVSSNFTNGFSGFGFGLTGLALPVRLIDFTGKLEKNSVVLNWKTNFEQNSKGFHVERSYDGNIFTSIGFVNAAGNSNIARSYIFRDKDVAQDINYYRLKETDLDNQFEYSKIVVVTNAITALKPFMVINNPFTNYLDIQFSEVPNGSVMIRLMDMTGRTVRSWNKSNPGLSRMRLTISDYLQSGTYMLNVVANGHQYVDKVIRQ